MPANREKSIRPTSLALAGNALDGDGNGMPGGNFVRTFQINSSLPAVLSAQRDTPLAQSVSSPSSADDFREDVTDNLTATDSIAGLLSEHLPNPAALLDSRIPQWSVAAREFWLWYLSHGVDGSPASPFRRLGDLWFLHNRAT